MATDTARFAQPLDRSRRRLTLVAMCIGQGMILLDNTIVNVALPAIQRGLGVTPGNLEWTVNAYVLALASLIILGGTLGDRYGRKQLYLIGLVVFTIFSAACGLAGRDVALIVCRGLQGVGAALMAPLTLSILVDAYPPEERTTAIGIWASVAGLGFGMGPIVGGLLIGQFGWPAVFWVNVPIGIAGFALALAAVRESRDPGARALDPVGNVLVSGGLFLSTFALIETNVHPWLSPYTLSLGALAVVLLAAFLVHEAHTAHPMVPLGLFKDRIFSSANALYMLAYASLAGMFFFVTLYFQNVKGWSAVRTGMSWIPLNAPFLAIAPFAGRIGKRYGTAWTVNGNLPHPGSNQTLTVPSTQNLVPGITIVSNLLGIWRSTSPKLPLSLKTLTRKRASSPKANPKSAPPRSRTWRMCSSDVMLRMSSSVSSGFSGGPSTRCSTPCKRITGAVLTRMCKSAAPSDTTKCNKSDIE